MLSLAHRKRSLSFDLPALKPSLPKAAILDKTSAPKAMADRPSFRLAVRVIVPGTNLSHLDGILYALFDEGWGSTRTAQ